MPQIINTNINSLLAQRNLNKTQSALETALARLSSGLRINSAKDDAAGLAIANRFTTQITGLNQAARNANDGISLAQTAEGGLNNITTNLQRIRELAVQAANGSLTSADRASLDLEAQQLIEEIDRVARETSFNGVKLLDGSISKTVLHVGANAFETVEFSLTAARTDTLGVTSKATVSSVNSTATQNTLRAGDLVINGVTIGESSASLDAASTTNQSASAIAKVAAINAVSDSTGVVAQVNANVAQGFSMTAATAATSGTITINGTTVNVTAVNGDAAATRAGVVSAINAVSGQTGVYATDGGSSASGVILTASDGRNIAVSMGGGANESLMGVSTGTFYGTYSLISDKAITIAEGSGNIDRSGLSEGTFNTAVSVVTTVDNSGDDFASGDFKINGVLIGATTESMDTASITGEEGSAIAKVTAINAISDQTGVTASVVTNEVSGFSQTALADQTGEITINGVSTSTIITTGSGASDRALVINAINAISGQTGVVAVDGGSSAKGVLLQAVDGRNIVVAMTNNLVESVTGLSTGTFYGNYQLTSANAITIEIGDNGTEGLVNSGLRQGTFGVARSGTALDNLSISTVDKANEAIIAIDNALAAVDQNRSNLGAVQNRLASTISSLSSTAESLTAARSRIQDADFAAETAALTRAQILQQAGVSILAQANSLPQLALTLLQ